ncbi:hypothetical protein QF028_000126 [Neobacillus sp. B4I6]
MIDLIINLEIKNGDRKELFFLITINDKREQKLKIFSYL